MSLRTRTIGAFLGIALLLVVIVVAAGSPSSKDAEGSASPSQVAASATTTQSQSVAADTPSSSVPPAVATAAPNLRSTPVPTVGETACQPTDQDRFVYNPDRLDVLAPCLRVSGTVAAIRSEADGDLHILLALDPAYRHLLTPANQGMELGDLVVEPVCVHGVTQTDAIATCAADPDPLRSLPGLNVHVWMEGRYVLDLAHGGWAELHPLYRWGPIAGGAAVQPSAICNITVVYKSGPSSAAGLESQTAPSSGALSWTWKVGTRTTPGSWPVTVSCSIGASSASQTRYLTVTG